MKKILTLITIASLAAMVTFSGCKKDEEEDMTLTWPTATITGIAYANLDLTNDTNALVIKNSEYAPSGTRIIAVYNTADLVDDAGDTYTYQDKTVETTVGSNGAYTLTIPARGKVVNVKITATDFTYDRIIWNPWSGSTTTTERKSYGAVVADQTVVSNDNKVVDINYAAM